MVSWRGVVCGVSSETSLARRLSMPRVRWRQGVADLDAALEVRRLPGGGPR